MSQIKTLIDEKHQNLFSLQDRWGHEKEYEDFNDYKKVVAKMFEGYGFTDVSLTKAFKITAKTPENKTVEVKLFKSGRIDITE